MKPRGLLVVAIVGLIIVTTISGYIILCAQTAESDLAWADSHRNIARTNNRLGALRHRLTQTHSPDFSSVHDHLEIIRTNTDNINSMETAGRGVNGKLKLHNFSIVGMVTESVSTLNTAHSQYEAQLIASIHAYQEVVSAIENSHSRPSSPLSESDSRLLDSLLLATIQLGNFSEENIKSEENKAISAKTGHLVDTNLYLQSDTGSALRQPVQTFLSNIALLREHTQSVSEIESVLSMQGLTLFDTIDEARLRAQFQNKLVFVAAIIQLLLLAGVFIYKALCLQRELVGQNLALEDTVAMRTERLETALTDLKASTSQQETIEAQLRQALRSAEKAGEAKSAFLANMSHEIRTPMNGVLAMLELVLREEKDPEKRDHLQISHSSARSLLNILDDVLDYSRLEAGQFTISPEPYKLSTIVEEVTGLFRSKAETKGVAILTSFDDDLPKTIVGDHARVRQVLSNFVSNALKFTEHGQIDVQVQREKGASDDKIRIDVIDTGIGISKEALTKLFQRFSQVDTSSTRRYGGTGLGLVICKQLVELMGGSVGADSKEGVGSNFWMTLPIGEASSNEIATQASAENKESENSLGDTPNYGLKILAAEDNPVNQKVLDATVRSLGYTVTIVNNGQEALEKLDSEPFDMILMDVHMPLMDGVSATKAIRALSSPIKNITIVALTANAMEGDRESYFAVGMDDYLSKPIERDKLADTLHRVSLTIAANQIGLSNQNAVVVQ